MARIERPEYIEGLLDDIPPAEVSLTFEKTRVLRRFPRLYPVRAWGRFRRHRCLQAGNWTVFYKVVDDTVYIRAIWPARIP